MNQLVKSYNNSFPGQHGSSEQSKAAFVKIGMGIGRLEFQLKFLLRSRRKREVLKKKEILNFYSPNGGKENDKKIKNSNKQLHQWMGSLRKGYESLMCSNIVFIVFTKYNKYQNQSTFT